MIGSREQMAIAVDRIACDGFGMCAELLPELIELDDWGYPIVAPGAVPADLLDHARRAVTVCPVLAFRLRRLADGEVWATTVPRPDLAQRPSRMAPRR
jgi:ferredoxin